VTYGPETIHRLLISFTDAITLNQAVADVNCPSLGAHGFPDAFKAHLRDPGEACGNLYGKDRLKMCCN